MPKFFSFFDYIYYRVAKVNSKWDFSHGSTGLWAVICCQTFIILDFYIAFTYLFLNTEERHSILNYSKFGLALLLVLLFKYNFKKYDGNYWTLHLKWKDENKKLRIRNGCFVIMAILLPILIPMLVLSF